MQNLGGWAIDVEVLNWIQEHIPYGETILELGSGTGTVELVKDWNVYSIEHDASWVDYTDSNYIYAPIVDGWYDVECVKKELPAEYSLILVDGPTGAIGRRGFIEHLELFNTDVPIIIDDTHREAELDIANYLINLFPEKEWCEIKSIDKKSIVIYNT
jgi:hypothetical protein